VLAKLHLEYGLPMLPALTLTGGVNYASDQFGDAMNTDRMAGYTLVDVGARYEMGLGNSLLTLRLDAYNLTDEHYWPNNGYVSDPRTIAVSANFTF
jgi:iron complex outermembrane recepter protein